MISFFRPKRSKLYEKYPRPKTDSEIHESPDVLVLSRIFGDLLYFKRVHHGGGYNKFNSVLAPMDHPTLQPLLSSTHIVEEPRPDRVFLREALGTLVQKIIALCQKDGWTHRKSFDLSTT